MRVLYTQQPQMSVSNDRVKTAEKYKTKGNRAFANEDYDEALKLYTLAIENDPYKPVFYANRALTRIKSSKAQQQFDLVAQDAAKALELDPCHLKAMYYMGVALTGLGEPEKALEYLLKSYELSLQSNNRTTPQVYAQIIETRKALADKVVDQRIERAFPLYEKMHHLLEDYYWNKLYQLRQRFNYKPFYEDDTEFQEEYTKLKQQYTQDLDDLRTTFQNSMKREKQPPQEIEAPEYLSDPISFHVFIDPVITPSGHTYERSTIEEHIERNGNDPLDTDTKLTKKQLIPNRFIKQAAQDWVKKYRST